MLYRRLMNWLELRWVAPAYSGGVLAGLSLFFFGAATNTMAGWLYVMSGVMLALLAVAAILPERMLRGIEVERTPIDPVSAGEPLVIALKLHNLTKATKTLIQVQDLLPPVLGLPAKMAIERIPAQESYHWVYQLPTTQRGIYRWQQVQLRTAAPLGLFWCRRQQQIKARAIVYPVVLPLSQCPLVDQMGQDLHQTAPSLRQSQLSTEGITRTLRPYRWGDSIRLVHWRTSARYGELQVRELETFTGGQELLICLDTTASWQPEWFEQAVVTAASLYFYALKQKLPVGVWTAAAGVVRGDRSVLETLAATQLGEARGTNYRLPITPCLWLSSSQDRSPSLPPGSREVLWLSALLNGNPHSASSIPTSGLLILPDQPLQPQLQSVLTGVAR